MIKRILSVIKWLLLVYVLVVLGAYFFQESLIFRPEKLSKEHLYSLSQNFEETNLTAEDGETINALHLKVEQPKGVILYFHGNAGNLARWGQIVSFFTEFNYNVFVIDYRGYGKSTGNFNEKKMYQDAQLAYDYIKKQFSEDTITVYGRSLGTTFATKVASENNPKQLILEAPFYSLSSIAQERYPFIPLRVLKYQFKTNEYSLMVTCPVTILHGTDDWVLPFKGGKQLFDELKKPVKEFVAIDGGGHNNLIQYNLYKETIKRLLN